MSFRKTPFAVCSVIFVAAVIAALAASLPSAAGQTCFAPTALNFTSQNGGLYVNGIRFKLKGTSWFGFETSNNCPHGLWSKSYTFFLDFLQSNGFNAIRLPFYLGLAANDATPGSIDYSQNADLHGLSSLQIMDVIIKAAASRGMVIMLDMHSFNADSYASDGLWYNSANPESAVIAAWVKILTRYQNQWNVIAADLKNEPFAATWGTGNTNTDFDKAASRIGNAIASQVSNRFLIFVEGTASSPGCSDNCFYGEDLVGVASSPVSLNNQYKLVYSPHVYGPQVYAQPYFSASNFPANMPAIWDAHWGYVPARTGNAVVIGEWGGALTGSNSVWMNALQTYLIARGLTDQFFWCLNPDSGDTGGLLQSDWTTPETAKLQLLAGLVSSPTTFSISSSGNICVTGTASASSTPAPAASASASPAAAASASPAAASPSQSPAAAASASPAAASPSHSPAAAASPSHSPAAASASPSPAMGGFSFYTGSSAWWFAVTVAGSTSVSVDCGNGQGLAAMTPGWTPYMWVFSSTNGHSCASTMRFVVNNGAAQSVIVPW